MLDYDGEERDSGDELEHMKEHWQSPGRRSVGSCSLNVSHQGLTSTAIPPPRAHAPNVPTIATSGLTRAVPSIHPDVMNVVCGAAAVQLLRALKGLTPPNGGSAVPR